MRARLFVKREATIWHRLSNLMLRKPIIIKTSLSQNWPICLYNTLQTASKLPNPKTLVLRYPFPISMGHQSVYWVVQMVCDCKAIVLESCYVMMIRRRRKVTYDVLRTYIYPQCTIIPKFSPTLTYRIPIFYSIELSKHSS